MTLEIPIDEQSKLFKQHLEEKGNKRIIFSGAFGIGKTYFLNKFFGVSSSEYLTVKLSPVNYSIASNEDIFKLIKFDILFELLAHHGAKQPGKIKIRPDIFYGLKLAEKADSFFTSMATFLGALNKDVKDATEVIAALATIHSQVTEFASASAETEENPEVNDFLKKMLESYFHEADDITAFIETALNQLAATPENALEGKKRKKVLVIDDLDRLDPEHIFRLFNVFSAHFDYNQSTINKFGFDKVIFVCDIRNIRNIFHSRYGADTDFTGYIDKFFSKEVYYFSNEKEMRNAVESIINSFNFQKSRDEYFQLNILQGVDFRDKGLLYVVLAELLLSGTLRIRRLEESYGSEFFLPTKNLTVNPPNYGAQEISYRNLPALVTIEILSKIIGGGEALYKAVGMLINYRKSSDYLDLQIDRNHWLVGNIIPIISYDKHNFRRDSFGAGTTYEFDYTPQQQVRYELLFSQSKAGYYFGKPVSSINLDLFIVLHQAIGVLLKDGLLK
jgi:hypothetical protein